VINGPWRPHGVAIGSAARFLSFFGKLFKEHEILSFVFGTYSTRIKRGHHVHTATRSISVTFNKFLQSFVLDVCLKGLST